MLPSSEVDDALQSQIELIKTGKQVFLYEIEMMTTNVTIVFGLLKMIYELELTVLGLQNVGTTILLPK